MNPVVYFLSFTNNFQTKTPSVLRHKNSLLPFLMQNREQREERRVLETNKYPLKVLWSLDSLQYTLQTSSESYVDDNLAPSTTMTSQIWAHVETSFIVIRRQDGVFY